MEISAKHIVKGQVIDSFHSLSQKADTLLLIEKYRSLDMKTLQTFLMKYMWSSRELIFTNDTTEDHAKIYRLVRPYDDELVGMFVPFGKIAPELGKPLYHSLRTDLVVAIRYGIFSDYMDKGKDAGDAALPRIRTDASLPFAHATHNQNNCFDTVHPRATAGCILAVWVHCQILIFEVENLFSQSEEVILPIRI